MPCRRDLGPLDGVLLVQCRETWLVEGPWCFRQWMGSASVASRALPDRLLTSRPVKVMCKEVEEAREETVKRIKLLRAAMDQDKAKRITDLTRRQAVVQRSLAETNELGEKVKAAEAEREQVEAEIEVRAVKGTRRGLHRC